MAGEWDVVGHEPTETTSPADDGWNVVATTPARKKRKRSFSDDVTGFLANVNRGLGIGDELAAASGVVTGLFAGRHKLTDPAIPAYQAELAAQRGREDSFAEDRPRTAALARGTGNALTMAAPIGPGAQAFQSGSLMGNALRGATVAGLTGAGYAAADRGTLKERAQGAGEAARDPITLGLGAAAGAAANLRPRARRAPEPVPTVEELRSQRTDAYDAVRDSGHTYSPEELQGLVRGIADDLGGKKLNPARHPKAASMLEDISATVAQGEPMTLNDLDQLRQVVRRDVASAADDADAFMGKQIIRKIDEFMNAAGGDAPLVRTARDLNTRVSKLDSLDDGIQHARRVAGSTGSGGNVDNATRQAVRRFLEDTPNLTPEEAAIADRTVMGTRTQNALRQVGKLSPQGNGLMTALSIGGAAANPTLAVPTITGAVSKVVADAITTRNVNHLRELIARGGRPAAQQIVNELEVAAASSPAAIELRAQLANDLAAAMGVQGASRQGAVEVSIPAHPEYGVGVSSR